MDKKHPNVVDATDPMFWRDSSEAGEDADTYQPEPEENDTEKQDPENMSIREMFANLPDGLFRVVLQQLIVCVVIAIACIAILLVFHTPQVIIGFFGAAWMGWNAISNIYDYYGDKFFEMPLICVSVQQGLKVQNRTRVVFRDQEDPPSYFEYFIPGRKSTKFIPNYVYIIYVKKNNPKIMVGFQAL